jgi:hypothetical protein
LISWLSRSKGLVDHCFFQWPVGTPPEGTIAVAESRFSWPPSLHTRLSQPRVGRRPVG